LTRANGPALPDYTRARDLRDMDPVQLLLGERQLQPSQAVEKVMQALARGAAAGVEDDCSWPFRGEIIRRTNRTAGGADWLVRLGQRCATVQRPLPPLSGLPRFQPDSPASARERASPAGDFTTRGLRY
jgi:hypothetical protein